MSKAKIEFKAKKFHVVVDENDCVFVTFLANKVLVKSDAKIFLDWLDSMIEQEKMALPISVCVDLGECLAIAAEARDVFNDKKDYCEAAVFINANKEVNRYANFGLSHREIDFPIAVFDSIEDGMAYLARAKKRERNSVEKSIDQVREQFEKR